MQHVRRESLSCFEPIVGYFKKHLSKDGQVQNNNTAKLFATVHDKSEYITNNDLRFIFVDAKYSSN